MAQKREKKSVGELPTWMQSHWPWVVGLLPFAFASIRLLIVSRGDSQIINELLQNLDVVGLLLSSVLPFVSPVFLWTMIFWSAARHLLKKQARKEGKTADFRIPSLYLLPLWVLALVVLYVATPSWLVLVNVALIAGLGVLLPSAKKSSKATNQNKGLVIGAASGALILGLAIVVAVVSLLLAPVLFSSMWLPKERISLQTPGSSPVVGYVLSSDIQWTRLLTEGNTVLILRTKDIGERAVISSNQTGFRQTPAELFG
ncbi:hypothetical protein [Gordonia sp. NPDC127522]|uniref:hypothetical protein n=1 Tax=Gordonia sp. NPDC127522 TaxID=3345390 RepID=UPI0036270107